ncbi:MAG: FAD-linked oxidase C-terminal domain-containing protein [Saprospiraceae bacterium]|nr:FAD-linked oxidase C-terminal domain-containing protein [Saprospiraceae bacterium]
MKYKKITPSIIKHLAAAVGGTNVLLEDSQLSAYSQDKSESHGYMPEVVVKPENTEGVSAVMKICFKHHIPVTVQGARSGLVGGALPVHGGVVLSTEKLDKILDIDKQNFQVTVEPGIITEALQNTLKEHGLFYPPDPAGRGWSFIGGNVATNAGGLSAVKYGVTREYVLNLEVVLPNGDVLWTGANTLKNSTGYNLTQLIVGSEGTLAVVTKIVLKLLPLPTYNLLLFVPFFEAEDACAAVAAIFQAGITPSILEFMERTAIDYAIRYVGEATIPIKDEHKAHLLIEVDGNHLESLHQDCEKIAEVVANFNADEILFADDDTTKTSFWKLRRNIANGVQTICPVNIEGDTVVPRAKLPDLLRGCRSIVEKYGLNVVCWGHLGDGNLHATIISETDTPEIRQNGEHAKREILQLTKSLNGMLSAEHGVGLLQKPYMDVFFNETYLNILRGIKKTFDPKGILNPSKIFSF